MFAEFYPRSPFRVAALLLTAVVATACGGGAEVAELRDGSPDAGEGGGDQVAPDFTLAAVDGVKVRLADTAGQVRLVDFWATWCAPCREEIPMLNKLHTTYGDKGFTLLAISDEDADVVRDFVKEHKVLYPNLVDDADVSLEYGVLGLPSAFLLDGEGNIIESFFGPKPPKILEKKIVELLPQG